MKLESDFLVRLNKYENLNREKKRNFEKLKVGDYLDVRDTEMVWCVAEILEIIGGCTHQDFLKNDVKVHYLSWHECFDEVIPLSSPRVSKLGYYTMQKGIPQYKFEKTNNNLTTNLLVYKQELESYQSYKRFSLPELQTCEEYYNYENSKISD